MCASIQHGFWKPFYLLLSTQVSPVGGQVHPSLLKESQELHTFSFTVTIKLTLIKSLFGVMQVQEPLLKKHAVGSSMKSWGQGYPGYWECCSMLWEKKPGKAHPKRFIVAVSHLSWGSVKTNIKIEREICHVCFQIHRLIHDAKPVRDAFCNEAHKLEFCPTFKAILLQSF